MKRSYGGNTGSGHWSQGLLASMEDPNLQVFADDKIVAIKDKYPKARHHFLILPRERIADLKSLKLGHITILKAMEEKGKELAQKYPQSNFKMGYHAVPSMSQVHLHVISDDFDSICLKTKRHWNSFNSDYFIPSKDVLKMLENESKVTTIPTAEGKKLLELPLKCHKCEHKPANMPALKRHVLTHL